MGNLLLGKRFRFFLPFSGGVTGGTNTGHWVGFLHVVKPYLHALLPIPMLALPVYPYRYTTTVCQGETPTMAVGSSSTYGSLRNCGNTPHTPVSDDRTQSICCGTTYGWHHVSPKDNAHTVSRQKKLTNLPDHSYCVLLPFFRDLEQTPFIVSGAFRAPLNERSAHARSTLVRRMLDPLVTMHTLYWLVATLSLVQHLSCRFFSVDGGTAHWQTGAVVRLVEVVFATFVPVRYMIWPPTTMEGEEASLKKSHDGYRVDHRYWVRREGAVLAWQDIAEIIIIIAYDWW
jgi:hypothetical protein